MTPPAVASPEAQTAAEVLRLAGFRRLWCADVVDGLGSQFATLALSVTAVVVVHASAWQVGLLAAVGQSAYLVIGLPAGVLVDRWPKKPMLVATSLIEAGSVASLPIAYVMHVLSFGQLVAVAAAVSVTSLLFDTAHTAILPLLVGPLQVSQASARLQTADSALRVIGPGIAGQLLRALSGPLLYVVTAAMGAVSAAISATIRLDEQPPEKSPENTTRELFAQSLLGGIRFVARHPVLRTFMAASAFINLGAGMFMAVIPVFVLRHLAIPAPTWGLAISFGALGGIAGSLLGLAVKRRVGELRAMLALETLLPLAFATAALAGVASLRPVLLIATSEFLFGSIIVVYTICSSGVRAKVTPQALFGRVSSASRFVTLGVLPIGALLGGVVASAAGERASLALAAFSAAMAPVVFTLSPLRPHRVLPPEWDRTAASEPR